MNRKLQVQLDRKTLLVFIIFFFLMHELHELAHITTGRIICGAWGSRDFNVWRLCANCALRNKLAVLATLAGPAFTFLMLWIGRYLIIKGPLVTHRSLGLALIFGNMQFGRMYMAATGSGDEITAFRVLFLNQDHTNILIIKLATFAMVSIISIPPLIAAYQTIGNKNRLIIFIGLLFLPLMLDTIVILVLLNGLLAKGLLSQNWILGSPVLITAWFFLCLLIVSLNTKSLMRFARMPPG